MIPAQEECEGEVERERSILVHVYIVFVHCICRCVLKYLRVEGRSKKHEGYMGEKGRVRGRTRGIHGREGESVRENTRDTWERRGECEGEHEGYMGEKGRV